MKQKRINKQYFVFTIEYISVENFSESSTHKN